MAKQEEVQARWRERVAVQEASGVWVRAYCKEHGIGEHSFHAWRQRLRREAQPVSFALVEAKQDTAECSDCMAEFALPGGERLRIRSEETALGIVLRRLRALA